QRRPQDLARPRPAAGARLGQGPDRGDLVGADLQPAALDPHGLVVNPPHPAPCLWRTGPLTPRWARPDGIRLDARKSAKVHKLSVGMNRGIRDASTRGPQLASYT